MIVQSMKIRWNGIDVRQTTFTWTVELKAVSSNWACSKRKYTYKEIESWKGFVDSLKSEDDSKLFIEMLNDCQKYALAIDAKKTSFLKEPLIVALLLAQHIMIWSWSNADLL
jgi:hypothetical protein